MMGFSVNLFLLHLTVPFFIIVYERVDFIPVHVLCNKIIYYNMMSMFFVKKMCYRTGSNKFLSSNYSEHNLFLTYLIDILCQIANFLNFVIFLPLCKNQWIATLLYRAIE
jgi:hypothetical protein